MKNAVARDWVKNSFAIFCQKLRSKIVEIVSTLDKMKYYIKNAADASIRFAYGISWRGKSNLILC